MSNIETGPDAQVQAVQLIQSVRRYIQEINSAIGTQIPLNAEQVLYEVPLEQKLREQLRSRFDLLVSSVCRRQAGRLAGINRTLEEAEKKIKQLSQVKKE